VTLRVGVARLHGRHESREDLAVGALQHLHRLTQQEPRDAARHIEAAPVVGDDTGEDERCPQEQQQVVLPPAHPPDRSEGEGEEALQ
jgi:hypothetical protein